MTHPRSTEHSVNSWSTRACQQNNTSEIQQTERCRKPSVVWKGKTGEDGKFLYRQTTSMATWLRRPPRERKILGSNPACAEIFPGSTHTSDLKLALQWLPCQAPGVIGSALGLVGLVLVYCDWVRWKVWSATSISVWQHVKLSVQIRPWDTLAWCWDAKQPTNSIDRNKHMGQSE